MLSFRWLDREIDDTVEGTIGVAKPTKVTNNVVWVVVTRPSMWRRGRSSETLFSSPSVVPSSKC
ncbi:hypothetical protein SMRU11_07665 (plasmid) [Sinorhizobium meliloti RU11/001]|nr:hypothetical protein SMRU11_07665 [Sinorhizobium meliloti RU11/001]